MTPQLRVRGQDRVFAVGDIGAVGEAATAGKHAAVVAANTRPLIAGGPAPAVHDVARRRSPCRSARRPAPELGVLEAAATSEIEGTSLTVERYREISDLG
ncbi:hypothetical protein CFP66_22310 [Pseudonocardia sp. MH-G8]|nr:hypothetical protein CFP66_22310 [Pseudonocardia sp. MH-G8]